MSLYPEEPTGIRDCGLLESALVRPIHAAQYEGADLSVQAATLLCGLVKNHPFHQGNKRTATVVAFLYVARAGFTIEAPQDAVLELVYGVEEGWTVQRAAAWFRQYVA